MLQILVHYTNDTYFSKKIIQKKKHIYIQTGWDQDDPVPCLISKMNFVSFQLSKKIFETGISYPNSHGRDKMGRTDQNGKKLLTPNHNFTNTFGLLPNSILDYEFVQQITNYKKLQILSRSNFVIPFTLQRTKIISILANEQLSKYQFD